MDYLLEPIEKDILNLIDKERVYCTVSKDHTDYTIIQDKLYRYTEDNINDAVHSLLDKGLIALFPYTRGKDYKLIRVARELKLAIVPI